MSNKILNYKPHRTYLLLNSPKLRFMARTMLATFLTLCVTIALAFPPDCGNLDVGGTTYDLSGLTALGQQEKQGGHTTSYHYRWFVCGNTGQNCGNVGDSQCGVCSAWEGRWDESAYTYCEGMYTSDKTTFRSYSNTGGDSGVEIEFGYADGGSISNLILICDPSFSGFENTEVDNSAIYNPIITVRSKNACPGGSSGGGGSGGLGGGGVSVGTILLILLIVGIVIYIVAGVMWNRFKEQRPWSDKHHLLPNYYFWVNFPGYVKDGVMFLVNTATGKEGEYGTTREYESPASEQPSGGL
mmetsp:Transcript_21326/g.23828  ORF Transcript_21326/g.23828 Transcript_21326/m.23828 type:complete len:299 (-) Transcript_21326:49-945(-)